MEAVRSVFIDAPTGEELADTLVRWTLPAPPRTTPDLSRRLLGGGARRISGREPVEAATEWLFGAVRANVKRGPVFDLRQALRESRADCLAYCKLFTIIGRRVGLDCGLVDVVIDPAGRYVPHTAVLVNGRGRPRFVDLWYGSTDVRHRRVGLRVREGSRWLVRDLDFGELAARQSTYLPDRCADGITLYVIGNGHLKRGEALEAAKCYTESLRRYPESVRPHYNRAIAREALGYHRLAAADYEAALSDEAAIMRTLAREHEEVTSLIQLDIDMVDETTQEMYVLRKGFVTGRTVPINVVARRFGVSQAEVRERLAVVERRLVEGHDEAR